MAPPRRKRYSSARAFYLVIFIFCLCGAWSVLSDQEVRLVHQRRDSSASSGHLHHVPRSLQAPRSVNNGTDEEVIPCAIPLSKSPACLEQKANANANSVAL